jgi:hypothetical protein
MEDLPDGVACKVLSCLTDTRSMVHFALASRRCNDLVVCADLVRNISVGLNGHDQPPRPINLSLLPGFKHCHLCFMCKGIIVPVPTNPGVVNHQCPHHTYAHPNEIILYRGPTDHLPQPTPCLAEHLKFAP